MPKIVLNLSQALAWIGSSILILVSIVSVTSILGRTFSGLGVSSIRGDYEIVEIGVAFAVFSFMPWCYVKGGHVSVDLFWDKLPLVLRKLILILIDFLMLGAWVVMGWQMFIKMQEYYSYQETTFLLNFPLWLAYAINIPLIALGCVVYLFVLLYRLGVTSGYGLQSLEP